MCQQVWERPNFNQWDQFATVQQFHPTGLGEVEFVAVKPCILDWISIQSCPEIIPGGIKVLTVRGDTGPLTVKSFLGHLGLLINYYEFEGRSWWILASGEMRRARRSGSSRGCRMMKSRMAADDRRSNRVSAPLRKHWCTFEPIDYGGEQDALARMAKGSSSERESLESGYIMQLLDNGLNQFRWDEHVGVPSKSHNQRNTNRFISILSANPSPHMTLQEIKRWP
ncbi:hypothetical protein B0H13DRAFT_1863088 [Mycena leptocephala]|nr:hypothetical protein B0H13DRAFT_1863088 [Mycena leptocephala]